MTTTLVLGDVAAEQWGLVTTAQARALGVPAQAMARLTERGSLERMTHGVYRVAGAPAEPLDSLRVAWLTLDPARRASQRVRDTRPEVVSHRSAANLHGLGDLESDMHEFITSTRKQTRRDDIRLHRSHLASDDWTVVDGLPVTTVARTVADLAASRVDGGHLAKVVRDALAVKQVSDDRLSASLAPHAHAYGAPKGEGEALLVRFLQESGVSEPLGRAVALSGTLTTAAVQTLASSPEMVRMRETMAELARTIGSTATTPELTRSIHQANAAMRQHLGTKGLGAMARVVDQTNAAIREGLSAKDLAAMARVAEDARKLFDTPEGRRLLERQRQDRP